MPENVREQKTINYPRHVFSISNKVSNELFHWNLRLVAKKIANFLSEIR